MIVKNESGRYLRQALERHREYIDDAVIIDDGSTDDTPDLCVQLLKGIPLKLVRNETSKFHNEIDLRKQQWEETLAVQPEWILNLDGDEWLEDRFAGEVKRLMEQSEISLFCFRLYDFWSPTEYREDRYWQAHFSYRPLLLRYVPGFEYVWKETAQHCGRFPENVFQLPNAISELRVKHMGWANHGDRLAKFRRYVLLDEHMQFGQKEQYLSILDKKPNLVLWQE